MPSWRHLHAFHNHQMPELLAKMRTPRALAQPVATSPVSAFVILAFNSSQKEAVATVRCSRFIQP